MLCMPSRCKHPPRCMRLIWSLCRVQCSSICITAAPRQPIGRAAGRAAARPSSQSTPSLLMTDRRPFRSRGNNRPTWLWRDELAIFAANTTGAIMYIGASAKCIVVYLNRAVESTGCTDGFGKPVSHRSTRT